MFCNNHNESSCETCVNARQIVSSYYYLLCFAQFCGKMLFARARFIIVPSGVPSGSSGSYLIVWVCKIQLSDDLWFVHLVFYLCFKFIMLRKFQRYSEPQCFSSASYENCDMVISHNLPSVYRAPLTQTWWQCATFVRQTRHVGLSLRIRYSRSMVSPVPT